MDENISKTENTIEAKDAVVGATYLQALQFYRIKILKKNGTDDTGELSSVTVESELEPLHPITISGATQLLPYAEELHKPVRTQNHKTRQTNHKKGNAMTKNPVAKRTVPRATIIDRELLKYKKGDEVNFDAIASKVIQAKAAPESKRASVIAQAKVRHAWYSKGGKKNPASVKGPGR
jgi:hypothetical protein